MSKLYNYGKVSVNIVSVVEHPEDPAEGMETLLLEAIKKHPILGECQISLSKGNLDLYIPETL